MNDTLTREDVDLEELFAQSIPCGGNIFPITRPCPHEASAALIDTHQCDMRPQSFKCLACHAEWLNGVYGADCNDEVECDVCGKCYPARDAYRPF